MTWPCDFTASYIFGALIGLTVGIIVGWVCHQLKDNGFWMYTYVHTDHSQGRGPSDTGE